MIRRIGKKWVYELYTCEFYISAYASKSIYHTIVQQPPLELYLVFAYDILCFMPFPK